MTPQDISKMAEERYPGLDEVMQYERDAWMSGYTAALTSPSSGIDTLRQWMSTGYNIEHAANALIDIIVEGNEKGEAYNDIQTKVYEYICTEMFKGVELSPPIHDDELHSAWLDGKCTATAMLPTTEECMEYAKGLEEQPAAKKIYILLPANLMKTIQYAQTGLKQL